MWNDVPASNPQDVSTPTAQIIALQIAPHPLRNHACGEISEQRTRVPTAPQQRIKNKPLALHVGAHEHEEKIASGRCNTKILGNGFRLLTQTVYPLHQIVGGKSRIQSRDERRPFATTSSIRHHRKEHLLWSLFLFLFFWHMHTWKQGIETTIHRKESWT
jgi:hypothetical protein